MCHPSITEGANNSFVKWKPNIGKRAPFNKCRRSDSVTVALAGIIERSSCMIVIQVGELPMEPLAQVFCLVTVVP